MTSLTDNQITIKGTYIIMKVEDNIKKEQVATIESFNTMNDGVRIYNYDYGIFGFHDGVAKIEQIRALTKEEQDNHSKNHYWKLPQQLYQSFPSC